MYKQCGFSIKRLFVIKGLYSVKHWVHSLLIRAAKLKARVRSKSCLFMMLFFLIIKVIAMRQNQCSPRAFSQVNCTTKKKKQHKLMPCFGPERSLEDFFKHYSGTDKTIFGLRVGLCCYCYFCL